MIAMQIRKRTDMTREEAIIMLEIEETSNTILREQVVQLSQQITVLRERLSGQATS